MCMACLCSRALFGTPCAAHHPPVRSQRPHRPCSNTVDGTFRRPAHRLTDLEAAILLDRDILCFGDVR